MGIQPSVTDIDASDAIKSIDASIGAWYRDIELDALFEVVALDEVSRTVEVQYADGAIGEFDFESWQQLQLKPAAAPEDSDIAYELSNEDRWTDNSTLESWTDPITFLEPESYPGIEDF